MTAFLRSLGVVVGFGLVAVAIYDMLSTVVAVSLGKGPLTGRISKAIWGRFLRVHQRLDSHRLLAWGGPTILVVIVLTWLGMFIAGWGLVFGGQGVLVTAQAGEPASIFGRFYYAGSLVLGRGAPAFRPSGTVWQFVEQIAAVSGVGLLSLSIAYVLPVVNAVVEKRRTAAHISLLGHTPHQVLERTWNGEDFGVLHLHLIPLAAEIAEIAERHLAYPVLHYFHSIERHTAIGPSMGVLDDTLTILECCEESNRLESSTIVPLRAAITEFLDTLEEAFVVPAEETTPEPDLTDLRDVGVPLVDEDTCSQAFDTVNPRRRLLRALLAHDGWDWEELSHGSWETAMLGRDEVREDDDEDPAQEKAETADA